MATKARISQISKGMFITSTMVSFISEAQDEQQQNLVASLYDTTGILANFNETRQYSTSLNCKLNSNRLYIQPGAFVSHNRRVISVPEEIDTQLDITGPDWVFIRAEQGLTIPFVRLSGSIGDSTLTIPADAKRTQELMDLVTPGMYINFKSDYDAHDYEGYEVLSISASEIQLKTPLTKLYTNEEIVVRTKQIDDTIDPETGAIFRWDTYEVATLNTGMAGWPGSPDWILLARIYEEEGNLYVENIRAISADEYDEHPALADFKDYIPNVANLKSTFTTSLLKEIRQFFTTGQMKIGDFQVDLVNQLHYQNTDVGTSNPYFDICCSAGVLRLGDLSEAADYIARLYTTAPDGASPTNYELPYVEGFSNTRLGCPDLPELRHAALGISPNTAYVDATGKLSLSSGSNIFSVSPGGNTVKNIELTGEASTFNGMQVTLLPYTPITFKSGGNIGTVFKTLTSEATFPANETLIFTLIQGTWYLSATGASTWNTTAAIEEMVNDYPVFKEKTNDHLDGIEEALTALEKSQREVVETVEDLKENILTYVFPPKTILSVDLTDELIEANFDNTGLGLPDTRYHKWAICNGNNATPNLQGRVLRMANSYMYSTDAVETSSAGGVNWPDSRAGQAPFATHPDYKNPTYKLSEDRYAGCHLNRLYIENLVPHKHPIPAGVAYTPESFFNSYVADAMPKVMESSAPTDMEFNYANALGNSGLEPVLWEETYGERSVNETHLGITYDDLTIGYNPDCPFDQRAQQAAIFYTGGLSKTAWTGFMSKYVHAYGHRETYFDTVHWGDLSRAALMLPFEHHTGLDDEPAYLRSWFDKDGSHYPGGIFPDVLFSKDHDLLLNTLRASGQSYAGDSADSQMAENIEHTKHIIEDHEAAPYQIRQKKVLDAIGPREYNTRSGVEFPPYDRSTGRRNPSTLAPINLGPMVYNAGDATIQRKNPVEGVFETMSSYGNELRYEDSLTGNIDPSKDNFPHPESRPYSIETPSYITIFLQLTV